ncbi:hypothetical protein B0H13DRAFT_2271818 [Mycena leptocephala]|nr:hypothetical protein B0H13DRAFT_2271818 [Mycena leptocephala]
MARFSMFLALFAASAIIAGKFFSTYLLEQYLHFIVSAPVHQQRALGSLQCNIDRFKIVSTLAATGDAVNKIDTTNPDTATAVTAAQSGLSSAGDGIKTIALALITGGTPPADARDQVGKGLTDAQTALTGITDATVTTSVADAQSKLAAAIQDGSQFRWRLPLEKNSERKPKNPGCSNILAPGEESVTPGVQSKSLSVGQRVKMYGAGPHSTCGIPPWLSTVDGLHVSGRCAIGPSTLGRRPFLGIQAVPAMVSYTPAAVHNLVTNSSSSRYPVLTSEQDDRAR